jgi:ATP-dependent exoDNAse (exonuclease V) alpha subunit
MMVNVEQIHYEGSDHYLCTVMDELGRRLSKLKLWKGAIGVDLKQDTKVPYRNVVVDYGYCITVHKSQGSEWDSVLVLESYGGFAWNMDRWRYTAVTRAANRLGLWKVKKNPWTTILILSMTTNELVQIRY